MAVEIVIEPGKVYESFDNFMREKPPFSIALDGIVDDITKIERKGPYANFDHHYGVNRDVTFATCAQVYMEIRMGRFRRMFSKNGIVTADGYIDKPDQDACLSGCLLLEHALAEEGNPALEKLVIAENWLDATGGTFPLKDQEMLRKIGWIFAPYTTARFTHHLRDMSATEQKALVFDRVHKNILEYIRNGGEELPLEGQYQVIGGGPAWVMVKETGAAARLAMHHDGVSTYISFDEESPEGRFHYTMGNISGAIDLREVCEYLNGKENDLVTDENFWGGGNRQGGSPKATGSGLNPEQLTKCVNEFLLSKRKDCP